MGGTAIRNFKTFSNAVGKAAASNVTILTTRWETQPPVTSRRDIQGYYESLEQRQSDLKPYFKPLIDGGAVLGKYTRGNDRRTIEEIFNKIHQNNT